MADETEGAEVEETTATPEGDGGNVDQQERKAEEAEGAAEAGTEGEAGESDWLAGLEDAKARSFAERYTSPAELAKAAFEREQELSRRIRVPGKDASEEDIAKFRKALGVPDTPDGYKIKRPEKVDEKVYDDPRVQGAMKSVVEQMHKAGATNDAVNAAIQTYWQIEADTREALARNDQEYVEKAEADLRKEWGQNYDQNLAFANEYLEEHSALKGVELKNGQLLASHPDFVKAMASAGRLSGEGRLQLGVHGTEAGTDLQQQYDDLSKQISDAYAKGDRDTARRLDAQRAPISEKLFGSRKIA